jgi:hypothetical protein
MNKKVLGCGVEEHHEDCLCDVHISGEPWEVKVTIPLDYWCGQEIVDHFDLGVPWTGADLATFFEKLAEVNGYINRKGQVHHVPAPNKEPRERAIKKLNAEQLEDLKDWIRSGMMPTPCVKAMMDTHGIVIHKSYVTKTKVRMIRRGELK